MQPQLLDQLNFIRTQLKISSTSPVLRLAQGRKKKNKLSKSKSFFSRLIFAMAEEFQGGVCGGNWWPFNSSRNLFGPISPCNSSAVNDFGWLNHDLIMDMKTTTTRSISDHDSAGSASDGSTSIAQKPSPNDWNIHDLLNDSGRILPAEQNYSQEILQESDGLNSSMNNNYQLQEQNPASNSYTNSACSFPLNSASYNFLQTLFDTDSQPEQADQQTILNNHAANHDDLQFTTNNTVISFWNSSAPASFVPSLIQPQFIPSSHNTTKPNVHNFNSKHKREEAGIINGATKKASDEPAAFKRQRIETPSPLPTFKVRKEKLGDRVTALQQLVSPFGKTDTASVLHEAIEYIKFLHDQVSVLSSPYLKNGSNSVQNQQVIDNNTKHQERPIEDLRSRGLCVVPISSTFPVATETTSDFWTPTFGGSFR